MKKFFTQSLVIVICLLPCLLAQAQNKVTGIAITPTQVGIVTYGNASSATYTVTLTTDGGSPDGISALSLNWVAPAGVSYSFSPASPVTLAAGSISQNVTLTITSDGTTDAGSYNFTVSCTNDVFTSGNASFVVDPASTTTSVSSDNNPSCFGSPVTFTATITSALSDATSQVEFFDGVTSLGTATISGTTAFITTSSLTAGPNSITAVYSGDPNYTGSTSPAFNQDVTANNTVTAGTTTTLCIGTAITPDIIHTTTGATGISNDGVPGANGLPGGVSATWAANTITISGTPTVAGTFSYSIPLTGGCGVVNATGTIIVTANNTVTAGTTTTLCINTAISPNITHTTTGATGISNDGISGANGLPAGVKAHWAANTITISGTPTVAGTFNYSIPLTGGCGVVNATGTIIVTANNTVTAGSTKTFCIGTAISPVITHTTTGATGISNDGISGANGLPTGVSAHWAGNTITISGTPTVAGTFSYSIPLTGGCGVVNATGTIIVTANNTVTAGTTKTLCINTAITPGITHTTTGATGISNDNITGANGLPAGVKAHWAANTITISGTPTVSGTFNYIIPLTGGCGVVNATGTIIVTANNTVTAGTTTTLCINTAISPNITHTTTGATGISNDGISGANGLPAGVKAHWAANTITISGTPTVAGTFNYSIPLTGGCGVVNATGTIIVTANNTVTAGSTKTFCIGTAISPVITHTTTGATGISNDGISGANGLPTGVSAHWAGNTITISGTPTVAGTFSYSIPLTGGCGVVNATGTIIVTANNTVTAGTTKTLCINTAITPGITHTTTGATGISNDNITGANGLPAGVKAHWAANTITISGTPTVSGTFNYIIPLTGGCGVVNATGTIIVTANNTVTAGTTTTLCINTAISPNITHTTTGATGISNDGISGANGLPAGVKAHWAANTITISGTPTVAGTFNYSIPLTGGCGVVNATGTIIVTANNTVTAGTTTTLCINTAISPNITHTTTGATGISNDGVSGANGLPTGVSAHWAGNTITISGTPTVAGSFSYSIPLTGGCGVVNATGSMTVNPLPTTPTAPSNLTLIPQGGGIAIVGTFTAPSPVPTNYLVIRTTSATPPTQPVDNVNYTTGSIALGGYIVSNNTATGFTDNGLTPNTQYWYWIYSYNKVTCGGPLYSLSNLSGTATTGVCTANTLYWAGAGSDLAGTTGTDLNTPANWSTTAYPVYTKSNFAPNSCTNATMTFYSTGNVTQTTATNFSNLTVLTQSLATAASATFSITNGIAVSGTFTCTPFSIFGSSATIFNITGGDFTCGNVLQNPTALFGTITTNYNISSGRSFITSGSFTINDQSFITSTTTINNSGIFSTNTSSGTTSFISNNNSPICYIKNDGIINFNGNTIFGASGGGPVTLQSISSGTSTGSKVFFRGNVDFESPATTNTSNNIADYYFDAGGSQTVTVNSANIKLSNVTAGSTSNPFVTLAGSQNASLTSIAANANITVNGSSTLDLSTHTLNRTPTTGGSITLNGTSTMRLAASTGGQTGSNFPLGFSSYSFNIISTVEYYGASAQTIFSTPVYGNLTLTNSSTKSAGGPLFIASSLTNNTGSTFDVVSSKNYNVTVGKDWKNNGTFKAQNGIVMFHSAQNATISGTSPTAFYFLGLNKGSDITTTIDVSGAGLISQTAGFPLVDTSGLLRINTNASFSKTTTDGTTVNSTAGIQNKGGTFATNGSIQNNGLFRNSSGSSTVGSVSGNELSTATGGIFDMQGGTLSITGRLVNTAGTASITGGTITLNTVGNSSSSVGSFDMSLTTNLTMNGTPVVYFQNAAAGLLDLHILNTSGIKNITGGTFQFGNGSTLSGNTFTCYSVVPVYNVTVNNTSSPSAKLTKDLTVNGALTLNSINSAGAFLINGDTLTLNGSISGTGTLAGSATSGLVIGGAAGTAYFTRGTPANSLKTLTINGGGSLTLGGSITSGDTLNIIAGDSTSGYGTLTVNGSLHTGNLLTLKSDVNGTALVGPSTGVINDTVTVERYFPALRAWRFVAVPFSSSNQTINSAWQEGLVNSVLQCPSQFTGTPGYGTEISGGTPANGYDVNNTGYPSIKVYQNNAWIVPVSTYSNLVTTSANNAYTLFVRGDRSVCLTNVYPPDVTVLRPRGILNQQGSSTYTVNFSGAHAGDFIFIGNPYAAPLDIRPAVKLNNSGIEVDKFWVWDPTLGGALGVGGYVAFSNGVQVPYNLIDTTNYAANTVIQSGESFMVQVNSSNSTGMGSVTFKENDKSSVERTTGVFGWLASPKQSSQSSFTQPSPKQRNPHTPPALYVNMLDQNNVIMDGVGVAFGNKYSPYIDSIDAQKKWNEEIENMAIVKHDTTLAIDFRPVAKASDTVFIRVYLRQHPYTLQVFTRGVREDLPAEGWLVDKYLGTQTQLDIYHVNLYTFTPNSDTNSYRNRFMLVFNRTGKKQQQDKGIKTSTNTVAGSSLVNGGSVSIYPNPVTAGTAMLNFNNMPAGSYQLIVYNAVGEKLSESMIRHSGGNTTYPLQVKSSWGSGIYNVRIVNTTEDNVKNISFILNK